MSAFNQWRQCSLAELLLRITYFIQQRGCCVVYIRGHDVHLHEEFEAERAGDSVGIFDATTPLKVIERKLLEGMLMEVS